MNRNRREGIMTPRPLGLALWLVVAVVAVAHAQTPAPRTELLTQGEQRSLRPGYAVGDIAIADPRVCDYRVLGQRREILLVAQGPGLTTLTLWDQAGVKRDEISIEVRSREFVKLFNDLTELVKPYPEVTVKALGERLVLSGTVATEAELATVRQLAEASGNVLCVVTAKSGAAPATVPTEVPPPPPPPVELPKPPVDLVPPPPTTPPDAAAGTVAAQMVEYTIDIYESPVSAPPPEVMGPQGKKLQSLKLRTAVGTSAQQLFMAEPPAAGKDKNKKDAAPAQPSGIHIALTPEEVAGSDIRSRMVVTTNLPLGSFEQKGTPVWVRAQVPVTGRAGAPMYVTELQLAGAAEATVYVPWTSGGGGKAQAAAGVAIGAGSAAASTLPGGSYLPGLGGLFGGGGGGQKMRPTVLLLVVTAREVKTP
jgi:hypothetical protein